MLLRSPIFMQNISYLVFLLIISSSLSGCTAGKSSIHTTLREKPKVIIDSDIGGSDPDDFQSMIHYMMYTDRFQTEGLIASPNSKKNILKIIDLYARDYSKLKKHADFPAPSYLRSITKQGSKEPEEEGSPARGWNKPTEGSKWIIKQAKSSSNKPLWILCWGRLADLAQALHDAPAIEKNIRVYWIGGPNKKWDVNSYLYIARNFPNLWMIENNSTYRGWFIDTYSKKNMTDKAFYENVIKGNGALGKDFSHYYGGSIKMGDTPSVAYLLNGNPDNPEGNSWGGSFIPLHYSAVRYFNRNTTKADTVPTYSVVVWSFKVDKISKNDLQPHIWMKIDHQKINGFYNGNGVFKVRFVPKRIGSWKYVVHGTEKQLQEQTGEFISKNPWPGKEDPQNIKLTNWWSDRTSSNLYLGQYQGAQTISKWRNVYLSDWAKRFKWLK